MGHGLQARPAALLSQLVLAATTNTEVATLLREGLGRRRRRLQAALERAVARGEIPAGTDVDVALDLLAGPVLFRFLVSREPVDDQFLTSVRDVVVAGLEQGRCLRTAR